MTRPSTSLVRWLAALAVGAVLAVGRPGLDAQPASTAPPGAAPPAAGAPSAGPSAGPTADPNAPNTSTPGDDSPLPAWLDRWLYNADERTRRGAAAYADGDAEAAAGRYGDALRLEPDSPAARYNAGTAGLAVGDPTASDLLDGIDSLGGEASEQLSSRAAYNRGTAALQSQDATTAVDALTESLRFDPDFDDAKHNLELALRLLEQQQQQQQQDGQDQPQDGEQNQDQQNQDPQDQDQQDQDQQDQDQQGEQEPQDQQDEQDPQDQQGEQEPQDSESQDGEDGEDGEQQQQQDQQPPPDGDESEQPQEQGGAGRGEDESPLPQFQDLPDMSAEEAAAILEAIENLEREQRRDEALEAARRSGRAEKDW